MVNKVYFQPVSEVQQNVASSKDVKTTMVYTHVLNRGGRGVESPLDRMRKGVGKEQRGIKRA